MKPLAGVFGHPTMTIPPVAVWPGPHAPHLDLFHGHLTEEQEGSLSLGHHDS